MITAIYMFSRKQILYTVAIILLVLAVVNFHMASRGFCSRVGDTINLFCSIFDPEFFFIIFSISGLAFLIRALLSPHRRS